MKIRCKALFIACAGLLWGCSAVLAGQYQLLLGESQMVPIAAQVRNHEQVCHVEIQVQGQPASGRELKAPHFETRIVLTPDEPGTLRVRWMGRALRTDAGVVNACPTEGFADFQVVSSNVALRAHWARLFSSMGPERADCMRLAFQASGVRPEWYDLNDPQMGADDRRVDQAFRQCELFAARPKAWGSLDPDGHACTLTGGLKTRCQGYYAEPGLQGRFKPISKQQAVERQLAGQAWTTAVRELPQAMHARLQREKSRLAAEQRALEKAEQTRMQAERDEQARLAAESKARAEKEEAERLKEEEEKARAEKERLEKRNWFEKTYDAVRGKG